MKTSRCIEARMSRSKYHAGWVLPEVLLVVVVVVGDDR
jgi:hypothetical protein